SLIVAAGVATLDPQTAGQTLSTFFSSVQAAGVEYTDLKNSGDAAGAAAAISQVRASTIDPFLAQANSGQDITMTSSQISTAGGGSIFVLATGALNVGTTLLASASQGSTGILTETGGAVNIFTVGDLNVNQSRLMTFQGGDITVWSDQGSINAGKGSKTAINASPPQYSCSNGVCTETFTPPAVGSGIRALTYATNPNTPAPPEGNIYLFAPSGDIDAGEAGISGGTVVLGATAILNASNISFSTGSVGLPAASQGVSLGALTGTSDMSKSTISSDTGALATSQERVTSAQPIEDMVVKWIDVKVMSYDLTFGGDDTSEENDDSRKKK
ncbi:MAG: filamentous hemagglutinin family protein, partial [Syntrophorhabdales bacterium]